MNKVILHGYAGNISELRDAGSTKVLNLTMATQRNVKKGDKWEKVSDWHNLQAWGNTAETMAKFLEKGSKFLVEGRIETQTWGDADNKKSKTVIVVQVFEFSEKKGEGSYKKKEENDPFAGAYKQDQVSIEDVPF